MSLPDDWLPVCEIPDGLYPIGSDSIAHSGPAHTVALDAFAIGLTVVTNRQFAVFMAEDGYTKPDYWSEMGWRWMQSRQARQPAFWEDETFNHVDQPVVGVSWYEALAFVGWLAHKTGQRWRLPSEAEWEAAARGPHGHLWPVGRAPDPNLTNTAERGIGRAWVALDVGNVSWCGAHDLCGNVWEWCSSRWGHNWQTLEYPVVS